MNNIFKLNGAAVALLSLLFCGILNSTSGYGPEPVNLGTAGDFAILTKTGVTTTGVTVVIGNVGTSPIAAAAITGFGLVLNSTTTFSTSSLVVGKVYAADYTAPTPAKLTAAIGDMGTAFIDAAGRSEPDHIELYNGDITGAGLYSSGKPALAPGLYKWSSPVGFTDLVVFDGSSTDIWILQIAGALTVGANARVILEGGALPENIFWQVSSATSIAAGASVQGILLCKTAIHFAAGSSLTGRALAHTAVTMSGTTIQAFPPTPPTGTPTDIPSATPTIMTTTTPTPIPTGTPTTAPTGTPTTTPTGTPTTAPTGTPTTAPTGTPTTTPTGTPTTTPTGTPTTAPTGTPTTTPTGTPTTTPTDIPTLTTPGPSVNAPTPFPTAKAPTPFPTAEAPTLFPTAKAPTPFPTNPPVTAYPTESLPTEQPIQNPPTEYPTESPPTPFPIHSSNSFPRHTPPTMHPTHIPPTLYPTHIPPTPFPTGIPPTPYPTE